MYNIRGSANDDTACRLDIGWTSESNPQQKVNIFSYLDIFYQWQIYYCDRGQFLYK